MKQFRFELDRVLDWRRQQLELERQKLLGVAARGRAFESELVETRASQHQARQAPAGEILGSQLAARDQWIRFLASEERRIEALVAECAREVERQRQAMIEAQRKVRLLEKLRKKRLADWRTAFDKEQEDLAQELYLARWNRS